MSEIAEKVENRLFSGGEVNNGGGETDLAFNQMFPYFIYNKLTLMVDFTEQHSVNEDNMKSVVCGTYPVIPSMSFASLVSGHAL